MNSGESKLAYLFFHGAQDSLAWSPQRVTGTGQPTLLAALLKLVTTWSGNFAMHKMRRFNALLSSSVCRARIKVFSPETLRTIMISWVCGDLFRLVASFSGRYGFKRNHCASTGQGTRLHRVIVTTISSWKFEWRSHSSGAQHMSCFLQSGSSWQQLIRWVQSWHHARVIS